MSASPALDLDRLLKLRVVVGRLGEGDRASWWPTRGQLSTIGARSVSRGFPRTHWFAQARAVFAVADARSAEVFEPKGTVTLFRLDEATEEAFDDRWECWLEQAPTWAPFFETVAKLPGPDLAGALEGLGLVGSEDLARAGRLTRSGHSVELPGRYATTDADVALLALAFQHSGPKDLAVPYLRRSEA